MMGTQITRRAAVKMGIAAALATAGARLAGCSAQETSKEEESGKNGSNTDGAQVITKLQNPVSSGDGVADFAANTAALLIPSSKDNSCYCPLSLYTACALVGIGTSGQTQKQALDVLQAESATSLLDDCDELYQKVQYFITCATGYTEAQIEAHLMINNSAWTDKSHRFAKGFRKLLGSSSRRLEGKFNVETASVTLGSSEADEQIESWMGEQTGGLLKPQIKTKSSATALLANTVFLKDSWAAPFDKGSTAEGSFEAPTGKVKASYMTLSADTCAYGTIGDCTVAEKPFANTNSKIRFILPPQGTDPRSLFEDPAKAADLLSAQLADSKSLKLKVPKFSLEKTADLADTVKALGITAVFEESEDFKTMLVPRRNAQDGKVGIYGMEQGACLKLDELGIGAAAYTESALSASSPEEPQTADFSLERPFAYAVLAGDEDVVVYCGCVLDPTKN